MRSTVLPFHLTSGLQAIGFRRNGDPIWPIMGGAPDDDGDNGGDGSDSDDDGDDQGDDGDGSDDGDDSDDDTELGPKGVKALESIKAKYKAERAERQKLARENAALKAMGAGGDDPAAQQRAAEAQEREEATIARANKRIISAEIRAAAAGKLSDPADALKFLDLDQFEVDEDGDVDQDDIADAITDLVAKKPYLAAQGGKKIPKPDRRQGGGQREATGSVAAGRAAYAARHKKTTV